MMLVLNRKNVAGEKNMSPWVRESGGEPDALQTLARISPRVL